MNTSLSDSLCLNHFRADVSIGAVSAGSIVIHFDVFEYCLSHLPPGGEFDMYRPVLQRAFYFSMVTFTAVGYADVCCSAIEPANAWF